MYLYTGKCLSLVHFVFLTLDMERPQVADGESAVELVDADVGGISFTDVRFGYGPDRQILKGLTFEASRELIGQEG